MSEAELRAIAKQIQGINTEIMLKQRHNLNLIKQIRKIKAEIQAKKSKITLLMRIQERKLIEGKVIQMKRKIALTQLRKLFNEKKQLESKEIPEAEQMGYMDRANVFMIVPLTSFGKEFFEANFEHEEPRKVPDLPYVPELGHGASYSTEYLLIILEFLEAISDEEQSIKLYVGKDFPLTMITTHFKFILAPRVSND